MKAQRILAVTTFVVAAAAANAQSFAYDSINGNYNWQSNWGMKVYNPTPAESWLDQSLAFQFTSNTTGQLSLVEVAARYEGSGSGAGSLSIYSDNSGQVGSLLATKSFVPTASSATGASAISNAVDFTSSNIALQANGKYWVEITPAANTTADILFNDVTNTALSSLKRGGDFLSAEAWRPAAGVRVQAVPEPASIAAMSLGLIALLRRRRTR